MFLLDSNGLFQGIFVSLANDSGHALGYDGLGTTVDSQVSRLKDLFHEN
jgi:hypothetical protein